MRHALALALLAALLVPAAAGARSSPAECKRIAQQLAHFEARQQRAEELDNDLWAGRFAGHIAELEERQAAVCPNQSEARQAARLMRELLGLAAQGALTFFTLGAL